MKFSKHVLAGLLLANTAAYAATPAEGWYAGLMGGLSYTQALSTQASFPSLTAFPNLFLFVPATINTKINFGVGGDIGLQVGYRMCNFRAEGELLFDYIPYSSLQLGRVTLKKHVTRHNPFIRLGGNAGFAAGFINGFYDFYDEENDPSWVPYLGVGIGYSYIRSSTTLSLPYLLYQFPALFSYGESFSVKRSTSTPMGQAIIGLNYFYSDTTSFGLDYRFMSTKTLSRLNGRAQSSAINLVLNFAFDN